MPVSRARAIGRSAAALIALAAIAFGVPVILSGVAGWPFPTSMPDLGTVWTRLQQGDLPAESVVKAMAIVVWLIWLQFVWAIAWELAVNARRVAERRPPRAAPFAPAMVSAGIGRLVAMVFSASAVVVSLPTPSLADSPPLVPMEQSETTQVPASVVRQQSHTSTEPRWVVQTGDTLWKVAETALGDGARCAEIIDLNADIRSARDVRSGQRLLLPADADIPSDRQGGPDAKAIVASESAFLEETSIVIEPGDTLWDLSTERLENANSNPPAAADVVAYVQEVIERNPDVIEDPDLIYPGEVFVMPTIGTARPSPAPAPDAEPGLAEVDAEVVIVAPVVEQVTPEPTPHVENDPTPAPNVETPYQRDAAPTASNGVGASVAPDQAEEAAEPPSSFAAAWTLAAGASTTLMTGLLLLRRRRQRLASLRGVHAAEQNPDDEALESFLVRAADVPLLTWARHELSSLFDLPELGPVSGVPVAVEISAVRGIEMLWSSQNRGAPRPWESTDGGWTWRATYDEDIEIHDMVDSTPLPGLVTVGARNGRDLMINLEAFGVLDLVGDPAAILDLARSMIVELSTDEILADTYVHVVGESFVDLPATGRHLPTDVNTARSLLARTTEEHGELLSEAQVDSTFELRRVAGASGREVATVVVSGGRDSGELRELATANRGVGLIVVGSTSTSDTHIVVESDGSAELCPMGIKFTAAALPSAAIASLVELVEVEVDAEPMTVGNVDPADDYQWTTEDTARDDAGGLALVGEEDAIADAGDCTVDEPPVAPEILVSVLGRPAVADFPELGRMDTNVVVFLATNGGEVTDSQLIDAVWNGRMVEQGTVWNRISKVRSIVGPLLPARASGDDTIRLARSARTDLDYFTALVEYADDGSSDEAIGLLSDALDLVNGPPFDAPGYEWSHQHQHHSRACGLVESTALRLVDLALDAGALASARRGVTQALKALPANEPLYRARMRIESAADNPSGVAAAFDELASLLAEMSEDGVEFEPSLRTVRLRSDLLDTSSVRSA
ncbi:LysM peptidoglycan-binding domain-containing protein [Ilumatobacter nonamiensis]|uniref:LysM peptidoglycan-binding domain-containing protein n=1 Tax=Ilumatobacter nonamiensis TaxID=467093 RepID=UPI0003460563|nr:LysM peptidoglycan-binding domain-containing protein [Ilumatobacter nonamiensis]